MKASVQVRHDHLPALPLPLHRLPGQDPRAGAQQDRPGAGRAVRCLETVLPAEVSTGLDKITWTTLHVSVSAQDRLLHLLPRLLPGQQDGESLGHCSTFTLISFISLQTNRSGLQFRRLKANFGIAKEGALQVGHVLDCWFLPLY